MSEDAGVESLSERLRVVEKRLESVHSFELRRWSREERSAERDFLTRGLVRVHARDDDLRSAGVDPTVLKTVFENHGASELGPDWESERLWEIEGDGVGLSYGYCWGSTVTATVHTEYYLRPKLAAKVNSLRAQNYLRDGGSVEEAEQCEGGYAFDRKFVEAVRAQRDQPTATRPQLQLAAAVLQNQIIAGQTYFARMLGGISTFLIVTALGTAVDELRTGLLLGLAAWAVAWILARLWHKTLLRAVDGVVDEAAAAAAGLPGDFNRIAVQDAIGRVFGGRSGRPVK